MSTSAQGNLKSFYNLLVFTKLVSYAGYWYEENYPQVNSWRSLWDYFLACSHKKQWWIIRETACIPIFLQLYFGWLIIDHLAGNLNVKKSHKELGCLFWSEVDSLYSSYLAGGTYSEPVQSLNQWDMIMWTSNPM